MIKIINEYFWVNRDQIKPYLRPYSDIYSASSPINLCIENLENQCFEILDNYQLDDISTLVQHNYFQQIQHNLLYLQSMDKSTELRNIGNLRNNH